jgi:transposase
MAFVGATDPPRSQASAEPVWAPSLHQGDVVVWDNIKPHQAAGAAAAVEPAGARRLPLPSYRPEDHPIEEMVSQVKQLLRRSEARVNDELSEAMAEAMRCVTPEDILGWFRHAGLCAAHG